MATRGVVLAAPSSACGKTLITLGLLAALKRRGVAIAAAKSGPDYIDPAFHHLASGAPGVNLDAFAMSAETIRYLATCAEGEFLLVEGAMGVHDGGEASTADLASLLGAPVILIMDIRGQAETAAVLAGAVKRELESVKGVALAGVVLNRFRSERHLALVSSAMAAAGIAVFGGIPECADLAIPSRHLGLKQAGELAAEGHIKPLIAAAEKLVAQHLDLDAIIKAARPLTASEPPPASICPPPAQRIAIADDTAFGFAYRHLMHDWSRQGAELMPFSPLADMLPDPAAEIIYLPGGYPELHLAKLSQATRLFNSLRQAAEKRIWIYGECGGYMVLGKRIVDASGTKVEMAGLLDCETDFNKPGLHLGYRRLERLAMTPLPPKLMAHEFHYTTATHEKGEPLFAASDRYGKSLGSMGLAAGTVFGSYAHIIAEAH